jgi:TonB family protein
MKLLIVLSLALLAGCTTTRYLPATLPAPDLITVSSLPGFTSGLQFGVVQVEVIFEVRRDGTITGIRMLHSSGDPDWDRLALETMQHWRFVQIPSLDDTSTLAVRTRVSVRPEEQISLPLGSLVVSTLAEAEILSALLESGASFDSLAATARWDSPGKRGKYLGFTDVGVYPYHIRQELRYLRTGKITPPIRLGTEYVIFKRLALPL